MVSSTSIKSTKKVLITSALPYVNNIPHMGNIIGCVLSADVIARYHRSQGNKVLYVCGTDEHGTATEARALEEGLTPQQICDKYYAIHKQVYDWFQISFDHFGRTSQKNHTTITQDIFLDLKANGYILERDVEQAYCEKDAKFLADRFVEGECPHCHFGNARGDQCDQCGKLLDPLELINPKCKTCGSAPVKKSSRHLFLDLAKLQPKLAEWIGQQARVGEWTTNAVTTTQGWLDRGLEPRAITRDLSWGVPVPGMEGKVFYVWFDAPIGYISITEQAGEDWKAWWQDPDGVLLHQFMAKDNIPFPTILFPASLIGTNKRWTMLHHIDATEYLQHEDGKFSKSRKTGLFGDDAIKTGIPADVFRYYLLVNRPETSDTVFSWKDLQEKLNKELLANLGNLVNRTLSFIAQFQDHKVHESILDEMDSNFLTYLAEQYTQVTDELVHTKIKEALRRIMSISQRANQYFQEKQPWKTRTENPDDCKKTMFVLANVIKDLAILLAPFLPTTSKNIFLQLGSDMRSWDELGSLSIANHTIGTPTPLFAKLEDAKLEQIKYELQMGQSAGSSAQQKSGRSDGGKNDGAKKGRIQEDNSGGGLLKPLQLTVGRIVDVYRHPNAQKLFVEQVDFGGGDLRTIVSGLVGHYREDDLRGKTAIFVTNLQPANLRGVTSQGMILAAQGDVVEVVFVDADPGVVVRADVSGKTVNDLAEPNDEPGESSSVSSGDELTDDDQLTIDEFGAHTLEARNFCVLLDGKQLFVGTTAVKTKNIKDGVVR